MKSRSLSTSDADKIKKKSRFKFWKKNDKKTKGSPIVDASNESCDDTATSGLTNNTKIEPSSESRIDHEQESSFSVPENSRLPTGLSAEATPHPKAPSIIKATSQPLIQSQATEEAEDALARKKFQALTIGALGESLKQLDSRQKQQVISKSKPEASSSQSNIAAPTAKYRGRWAPQVSNPRPGYFIPPPTPAKRKIKDENEAVEALREQKYFNAKLGDGTPAVLDEFRNLASLECDLGRPGAFKDFTVLFYSAYYNDFSPAMDMLRTVPEFRVFHAMHEDEFLQMYCSNQVDQIWIVCSDRDFSAEVVNCCVSAQAQGVGLFVWADNAPYIKGANSILKALGVKAKAQGFDPGQCVLTEAPRCGKDTARSFQRHLIFTGITNLYEGYTVSFLPSQIPEFEILATNSSGRALIACRSFPDASAGRILIDCGFTRLLGFGGEAHTAGTDRYVRNCAVWLLGLECKMANNQPLKVSASKADIATAKSDEARKKQ